MNPGETERCEVCRGYPEWCGHCTLREYLEWLLKRKGDNERKTTATTNRLGSDC